MHNEQTKRDSWEYFLLHAAHKISLSEALYEKIAGRYEQLQAILSSSNDDLLANAHIFVQGSMKLRTTIKPAPEANDELGTIDADAIVWLPNAKGAEATEVLASIEECFKNGSRVRENIQKLRRGIRIVYADENPGFHIDVTPARPITINAEKNGEGRLEVPDREIGWKASSPIPYATWLQMASAQQISLEASILLEKRSAAFDAATQDPLPEYDDYIEHDPLRAAIKLLKRHRDEWAIKTGREAYRPISAVITTLATHAYLDVVNESKSKPLRPLDAIILIIQKMPNHIKMQGSSYFVCNPTDEGENFAEKWNRQRDGHLYKNAFATWHTDACSSISLGLESFDSQESFTQAVKADFGLGASFVNEVNQTIPKNWTLPGRSEGTTQNQVLAQSFFGTVTSSGNSQENVKPVGRLG